MLKPLNDWVIIHQHNEKEMTEGGIAISQKSQVPKGCGTVLRTACDAIKEGDIVYFALGAATVISEPIIAVQFKHLIGVHERAPQAGVSEEGSQVPVI